MKSTLLLPFLSALCIPVGFAMGEENSTPLTAPDDSFAHLLKAEKFFDLAQELGDSSEAGMNQAAILMANAKRIDTEGRIGSKSMRQVLVLADWREALNRWSDVQLELVWCWNGGGMMYYHMMQRNDAYNEDFLAEVAERLPLATTPVSNETAAKIDDLLKKAKARLAQIKAETTRTGIKPLLRIDDLPRRLEEAHAALKQQFPYAGDEHTTRLLLDFCEEPPELWD
jgi:hypothetical protein